MKILSIVGARPQYLKLAAMDWRFNKEFKSCEHIIVDTGQHYDKNMSSDFFSTLEITKPHKNLQVGSGTHAVQTATMLIRIEEALQELRPNHVVLYGDTNSTLAGALAASKLAIPISHVEAGLRSFNQSMPEEINRILTDHVSSLLFAPTMNALMQLEKENLGSRSFFSGDLTIELINFVRQKMNYSDGEPYIFATIHRSENTVDEARIKQIILKLRKSPLPVHLHCHPRLLKILEYLNLAKSMESLVILGPLNYFESISSICNASGVITDSGGVQKEAYLAGKPCLVVRTETEWIETLQDGTSKLDPNLECIKNFWQTKRNTEVDTSFFGDGTTSRFVIQKIIDGAI